MSKKTIITIVVAVVIVVVAVAVFVIGNHGGATRPQSQSPSVSANLYTSSDDGFSVSFSGVPQITKTTFNSPTAGAIPLTKYLVPTGNGSSTQYAVVYVYHYPQTYQFPSGYLTGAMDLFALAVNAKYPGAKLASQQPTQFLGNAAVAGTITVTSAGQQSENYLVITTKNHNTYGIGTYGMDQNDYNAFVDSFTFTQ